jgi:hypothetical protein
MKSHIRIAVKASTGIKYKSSLDVFAQAAVRLRDAAKITIV